MDAETEKWIEGQIELFSMQGWKDFVEKATEIRDLANVLHIRDLDHLRHTQGVLENLNWIIGWEKSVRDVAASLSGSE